MALIATYLTKAADAAAAAAGGAAGAAIPWSTLRYLIGEAMYGGRVSDGADRRVLATYLAEYLGDFLFDAWQPFAFHRSAAGDYIVPRLGPRDVYTDVRALPF